MRPMLPVAASTECSRRQQARGLAFVGLRDQRDAAVGREAVDAAVLIGGEEDLLFQREHVVDVLFLRTPQRLDGVVGIDAVERAIFSTPLTSTTGSELRADLRRGSGDGGGRLRRFGIAAA